MDRQEWIKEAVQTLIVWRTMADNEYITHNPERPGSERDLLALLAQTENLILDSPEGEEE